MTAWPSWVPTGPSILATGLARKRSHDDKRVLLVANWVLPDLACQVREKLKALKLDNAPVWARERIREKDPGRAKARALSSAPFVPPGAACTAGCLEAGTCMQPFTCCATKSQCTLLVSLWQCRCCLIQRACAS